LTSIDATTVPTLKVAAIPVGITVPATPQAKSPQLCLPQPVLISPTVVSSPKVALSAIPVTSGDGLAESFHWFWPQKPVFQVPDAIGF